MPATRSPEATMLADIREGFEEPDAVLHYDHLGMVRGAREHGLQVPRFAIIFSRSGTFGYDRFLAITPIRDGDTDEPVLEHNFSVTYSLDAPGADMEPVVHEEQQAGIETASPILPAAAEARPLVIDYKIATLLIPQIVQPRSTP